MKKVLEIITYLAALAFVLALSFVEKALDNGSIAPFVVMFFCAAWIIGYGWIDGEERRLREGR